MLTSLALIFLIGLSLGEVFNKLKLPRLIGMIFTGIIIGPYALNLLDDKILGISSELRQIALVIILTRAGLSLNVDDLKKVGRPAFLMCFVPAILEIAGVILVAPKLLGITVLEAAIMGSVIAAVSPAVIVPRMIKILDEGYGKEKSIPQLILAGASVDDVFVIVLFSSFTSIATGGNVSALTFVQVPVSILLGIGLGIATGLLLIKLFKSVHIRDTIKVIIVLSVSFVLLQLEHSLEGIVPISALIAIMTMGITFNRKYDVLAKRFSARYNQLWVYAEVILFVLVGATVDINYALKAGMYAIIIVFVGLLFRMIGVFLSLAKTDINKKERLFCAFAYTPKATVQAAIGGVPLAMGLACGQIVLTVAVLSILITAPLGAMLIDLNYKKLLSK